MKDKVVIITGGADGIGAACVDVFLREGSIVVILDYNSDKIKYLNSIYVNMIDRILIINCDVTNQSDLENAIKLIINKFGKIDSIIHNAGSHHDISETDKYPINDFYKTIEGNLISNFLLTRLAIPYLKNTNGTMVFVTSMIALVGRNYSAVYCATKAGQIGMMKSLAIELAPSIRVNAVAPSNVLTNSMKNWLSIMDNPELVKKKLESMQKLGRMAEPIEIAEIIYFLASSKSSFITGQVIQADGGATLDYH